MALSAAWPSPVEIAVGSAVVFWLLRRLHHPTLSLVRSSGFPSAHYTREELERMSVGRLAALALGDLLCRTWLRYSVAMLLLAFVAITVLYEVYIWSLDSVVVYSLAISALTTAAALALVRRLGSGSLGHTLGEYAGTGLYHAGMSMLLLPPDPEERVRRLVPYWRVYDEPGEPRYPAPLPYDIAQVVEGMRSYLAYAPRVEPGLQALFAEVEISWQIFAAEDCRDPDRAAWLVRALMRLDRNLRAGPDMFIGPPGNPNQV